MRFQTIEAKPAGADAVNVRLVTAIGVSQHLTPERPEAERPRAGGAAPLEPAGPAAPPRGAGAAAGRVGAAAEAGGAEAAGSACPRGGCDGPGPTPDLSDRAADRRVTH